MYFYNCFSEVLNLFSLSIMSATYFFIISLLILPFFGWSQTGIDTSKVFSEFIKALDKSEGDLIKTPTIKEIYLLKEGSFRSENKKEVLLIVELNDHPNCKLENQFIYLCELVNDEYKEISIQLGGCEISVFDFDNDSILEVYQLKYKYGHGRHDWYEQYLSFNDAQFEIKFEFKRHDYMQNLSLEIEQNHDSTLFEYYQLNDTILHDVILIDSIVSKRDVIFIKEEIKVLSELTELGYKLKTYSRLSGLEEFKRQNSFPSWISK